MRFLTECMSLRSLRAGDSGRWNSSSVSACAASLPARTWASPPAPLFFAGFRSNARHPEPWCITSQRTLRVARHRSSELWTPLGPGSSGPAFPGNIGNPAADPPDHLFERRRDAGHLRHATGWIPIPPVDRCLPAHFRRHDLFGTDTHRSISPVVHETRLNFMSEARIWSSRDRTTKSFRASAGT